MDKIEYIFKQKYVIYDFSTGQYLPRPERTNNDVSRTIPAVNVSCLKVTTIRGSACL